MLKIVSKLCIGLMVVSATGLWNAGTTYGQRGYQNYSYKPAVPTQNWAQSLFSDTSHNFGTVARAAKAEHVFSFKNDSDQNIEILNVTASCTCTKPEVPQKVIQPGEEGQVIAKYQTRQFSGQRGATLNVSIRKGNSISTAMLKVDGFIRQDVVVHPESVEMQGVLVAEGGSKKIKIMYAGRSDWEITKIKCEQPNVQFTLQQTLRQNGRVEYELETTIPQNHPMGEIRDMITVFTNDRNLPSFPVSLTANVVQPIRVNDSIVLNVFEGDTVVEKLLLASSSEFQIIDYLCESCPVNVKLDGKNQRVHQLEIAAEGLQEGRSEHILKLTTNHPQQPITHVRLIIDVQTGR